MAHKRGVLNGQDVPKLEGKFNFYFMFFDLFEKIVTRQTYACRNAGSKENECRISWDIGFPFFWRVRGDGLYV